MGQAPLVEHRATAGGAWMSRGPLMKMFLDLMNLDELSLKIITNYRARQTTSAPGEVSADTVISSVMI